MFTFGAARYVSRLTTGTQYGPDRGRRQIDQANARLASAQERIVLHVRAGRGRVEHEIDVSKHGQTGQTFDAFMRGSNAKPRGARETVGVRIDADHRRDFEMLAVTQDLDHQIGADVAGADDRDLQFFGSHIES
ncbi:hypothetical protein QF000_001231 [Paraburkholderia atlantica]